jgi:nucleoid DNA-binding protein
MKQSDLIKLVSNDVGVKYEVVRRVLRKTTVYLAIALKHNDAFRIGMGTFSLKQRGPKPVRNFKTGETWMLPPAYKVIFTPSNYIKGVLKQKDQEQLVFDFQESKDAQDESGEEAD